MLRTTTAALSGSLRRAAPKAARTATKASVSSISVERGLRAASFTNPSSVPALVAARPYHHSAFSNAKPSSPADEGKDEEKATKQDEAAAGEQRPADAGAAEETPKQQQQKSLKKPGKFYHLVEGIKDVLAVTLGMERKRDVEAEYDAGLRAYPWIQYQDPHASTTDPESGEEKPVIMYKNLDTGVVTEHKPDDFELRAPASARMVQTNATASDIMLVKEKQSGWQRTTEALRNTPVINALMGVTEAVAAGPVGQAAKSVKTKVQDKIEDAREVWETSQHPLVVNAAYAVDSLMAETESGRALREIQLLDSGFDQYAFLEEMTSNVIPTVVSAFFRLDMPVLRHWCKDSALAQMRAVAAAREIEGLTMDGTILAVQKPELVQAKSLERGVPIILVSSQVQYIHCIRSKKTNEVTEGSESEIRAAFFVFAVTREVEQGTGKLAWRVVEMSMQGSQLYL